MGVTLDRSALGALGILRTQCVNVPELGGEMIVRELTAREIAQITEKTGQSLEALQAGINIEAGIDLWAWLLRWSWVNEEGRNELTDADIPALINMSLTMLTALFDQLLPAIIELNGLGAGAVVNAKKN